MVEQDQQTENNKEEMDYKTRIEELKRHILGLELDIEDMKEVLMNKDR